jgi:hypothetical protein
MEVDLTYKPCPMCEQTIWSEQEFSIDLPIGFGGASQSVKGRYCDFCGFLLLYRPIADEPRRRR